MMVRKLEGLADSPEKTILTKINQTYALTIIMENRDWYLENDYMEGSKTKALRRVYDKHIASFRKDIVGLAASLGVNDRQFYVNP